MAKKCTASKLDLKVTHRIFISAYYTFLFLKSLYPSADISSRTSLEKANHTVFFIPDTVLANILILSYCSMSDFYLVIRNVRNLFSRNILFLPDPDYGG